MGPVTKWSRCPSPPVNGLRYRLWRRQRRRRRVHWIRRGLYRVNEKSRKTRGKPGLPGSSFVRVLKSVQWGPGNKTLIFSFRRMYNRYNQSSTKIFNRIIVISRNRFKPSETHATTLRHANSNRSARRTNEPRFFPHVKLIAFFSVFTGVGLNSFTILSR